MLFNWLRSVFSPRKRPLVSSRRPKKTARQSPFRPQLMLLEDRLAPANVATLSVTLTGTTLVYYGTQANNIITVTGSDNSLTFSDSAGGIGTTLPLSGGASGSHSVSVDLNTLGSAVPITAIQIIGGGGFDTLNLNGPSVSQSFTASVNLTTVSNTTTASGGINLTALPGGQINLNSGLSTTNSSGPGGNILINGQVIVGPSGTDEPITTGGTTADGNVTFNNSVIGAGGLAINNSVSLGTNVGGNVAFYSTVSLSGDLLVGAGIGVGASAGANSIFMKSATVLGPLGVTLDAEGGINLNGALVGTGPIDIAANLANGNQSFNQSSGDIITSSTGANPDVSLTVNTPVGGTGSARIDDITTGAGGTVIIDTQGALNSGGPIFDGNGASPNVRTGLNGQLVAEAGPGGMSLDTQTSNMALNVSGAGDINVRNSAFALVVDSALPLAPISGASTTNGNIKISNSGFSINTSSTVGDVAASGALKTVTLTTTGATSNVVVDVGNVISASSVVINAGGSITTTGDGGSIQAPTISLTAGTGIGSFGSSVPVAGILQGNTTVSAATTSVTSTGIFLADTAGPLTIAAATATAGNINIASAEGFDLTTTGTISAKGSATVTLASANNINVKGGTISSVTGLIEFTPTQNFTVGATATVTNTTGGIQVDAPTEATVETIAGTLAVTGATGNITVNGDNAAASTNLIVTGKITTKGGNIVLQTVGNDFSPDVFTIGGTISTTTAGNVTITDDCIGTFTLTMTGTLTSAGTTTIADTAGPPSSGTMTLTGKITSVGNLAIDGDPAATTVAIGGTTSVTGATSTLTIEGFNITASGTISATTGLIDFVPTQNLTISGTASVTNTTGGITVTAPSVSGGGTIETIAGKLTSTGPVTINGASDPTSTTTLNITGTIRGSTFTVATASTDDTTYTIGGTITALTGAASITADTTGNFTLLETGTLTVAGTTTISDGGAVTNPLATMTLNGKITSGGLVTISGTPDFTNVSTNGTISGNGVTIIGENITVQGGAITSSGAAILFMPTQNITIAAAASITDTGGSNIQVQGATPSDVSSTTAIETIAGKLTTTGEVEISGATDSSSTTLNITGKISANTLIVDTEGSGDANYNIGGTITTTGGITQISDTGSTGTNTFILLMNGTLSSTGPTTIEANDALIANMTLAGKINSSLAPGGAVTIDGTTVAAGATNLNISGSTYSGAAILIAGDGGAGTTFSLNATGLIQGSTVTVDGTTSGTNTLNLSGPITATSGGVDDIIVNTGADTVSSSIFITGKMNASGGNTYVDSSTGASDYIVVTPSTLSPFTFDGGDSTQLIINTSPVYVASYSNTSVVFQIATSLQPWTIITGNYIVTL